MVIADFRIGERRRYGNRRPPKFMVRPKVFRPSDLAKHARAVRRDWHDPFKSRRMACKRDLFLTRLPGICHFRLF